jgi:hypothetical protein
MGEATSGKNEPSSFLERLGDLLRETSKQEILPRFQRLTDGDIASKASKEDPTDILTIAVRTAEEFLTSRLLNLWPGSRCQAICTISRQTSAMVKFPLDGISRP